MLEEVKNVEQLKIGKKIRCHYKATSNTLGTFSGLGKETSGFISPTTSSAAPNGDFYFICVDRDYLGRWKLIADRNIQHSISWDTLNSAGIANGSGLPIELDYENVAFNKHVETDTNHFENFSISKVVDGIDIHTDGFLQSDGDKGKITRIIIDLGKEEEIDGLALTNLLYTSGYRCKNFGFSWSNDKNNWNFIMNAVLPNNEIKHFFKAKARARYFSILLKDSNLGSGWSLGIGEIELIKTNRQTKSVLRLLTGGTSPEDEDNEWNKYIVNDTLNGLITPGDDNIWNWKSDTPSWTSATQTIASRRVRRGGGAGGLRGYYSDSATLSESNVSGTACGFRPVLLLLPPLTNSLIYHDDKYKTYNNGWKPISTTLPSKDTFMNDGMSDLSVLERKGQIVSLPMISSALGEGRVFKTKIDYKKYFDINSMDVK
ncbi:MAG: discoidin domain-containing protein [Paenibacillus dendritiformis]|uniref:discoidin domain-containing protein n=1 Tax=uncultured Paenibacillus sp. TaxID=227322 RepID=UPI0025D19273|nr:discoidin domain-containing protein [uncultured Paenibacillus sp.]MDU5143602.1 discoidin domain-containing protein [Paenibacillus dendritiformis]